MPSQQQKKLILCLVPHCGARIPMSWLQIFFSFALTLAFLCLAALYWLEKE